MGNLYDEDLVLWAEEQGRALRAAARAGWNSPIDWENVAEEIETLGRSERHALASHIAVVIEHLLKLQVSPATDPTRGWRDTIRRARREIQRRLKESPSLRREVANILVDELTAARSLVLASLQEYGEQPRADIGALDYTEAQVLGDWLPDAD
jgi:hypothetical protein